MKDKLFEPSLHEKVMGILAYLIFIVPLIAGKKSRFISYHTEQGMCNFFYVFFGTPISIFIGLLIHPVVGMVILSLIHLTGIINNICGIINVCKYLVEPVPVLGSIYEGKIFKGYTKEYLS